ncbi:Ig-like domain-containing protein, partial [Variovorax ureilyticus]
MALNAEAPIRIKAQAGSKYLLKLNGEAAPENATLARVGNDLHLTLEGDTQPAAILEGYFLLPDPPGLYGQAEDGQLYRFGRTDGGEIFSLADGEMSAVALAGDPVPADGNDDGGVFWPLLMLGGLAAGGLVATSGGGSSSALWIEPAKSEPPTKTVPTPGRAGATDHFGPIQGPIENHGVTDDPRPEITGTGSPGDTITIYDNGTVIGKTVVDGDGNWQFTPDVDLSEGPHSITTTETDSEGNTSSPSEPLEFGVDRTPPGKPSLGEGLGPIIDDYGSITGPIAKGGVTDDARPEFTGKGEPGNTITIYDNGSEIGQATVDDQGNWHFTPPVDLGEGPHAITITETDPAGNESEPSDPFDFGVDTVASIPSAKVDGAVDESGLTGSSQPTLSGTGEPGDRITVTYPDGQVTETVVKPDGTWTAPAPAEPLPDGSGSILVTETDEAGNSKTVLVPVSIDTEAPAAPEIGSVVDNVAPVEGPLTSGQSTNDDTPTLSGTAEPGSKVTITDNGEVIGVVDTDPDTGAWTFTPDTPLTEGNHVLEVTATDPAGNTGPGTGFVIEVDTGKPAKPELGKNLESVIDNVGEITGPIAKGGVTDDTRPEFTGKGEPGGTITIYDNGKVIGEAVVEGGGNWKFTPPIDLGEGAHSITITQTDKAGNVSDRSDPFDFAIDTVASIPSAKIDGAVDESGLTSTDQPTLSGTGEPGDRITITYPDGQVTETVVKPDGTWTAPAPAEPLPDGGGSILVTETDEAGNSATVTVPVHVDTEAPAAPEIGSVVDNVAPVEGPLTSGQSTNDDTPTLSGTAEPGSKVTITDNGEVIGVVDTDPDTGVWTFTPDTPLTEGNHVLEVTATDPAGNTGPGTEFVIEVDTVKPDKPDLGQTLEDVYDDQPAIIGSVKPGDTTNDSKPEFSGVGTPGDTITLYDETPAGPVAIGSGVVDGDGSWTITPDQELKDGDHSIRITVTDPAGNESDPSDPFEFSVDATAPAKPDLGDGLKSVIDNVGEVTGPIAKGGVTDDAQPEFNGRGEAGGTITVYDNGVEIGSVVVDDKGNWSLTPEQGLDEGQHSITITETDKAGNASDHSDPFEFSVDLTAPDASKLAITGVEDDVGLVTGNVASGATTDDSRPVIHGTGTAGDTIIVMVKDASGSHDLGRATVDANGNWSLEVTTPLASGSNEFTAIEMDPAGNKTAPSAGYTVVVDTGRPEVPVIENIQDDVGAVHMLQKGEVTDDARPTILGTGTAGNTIKVYDGATLLGQAQVDANGKWSFTPGTNLTDGAHNITATATNPVGQTSDATGVWNFVVDTKAPEPVSGLVVTDDVGAKQGPLSNGDTTDDSRPTFSGKAEPGSTVTVYDGGAKLGEVPVDGSGNWSFTPSTDLADGSHSFTTVVTDPAGNTSAPSAPVNVSLDTSKVEVSISALVDDQGAIKGNIAPNGVTDDTRPEITGKGKAGSTVTVYD